jgi:hypothetical protein
MTKARNKRIQKDLTFTNKQKKPKNKTKNQRLWDYYKSEQRNS